MALDSLFRNQRRGLGAYGQFATTSPVVGLYGLSNIGTTVLYADSIRLGTLPAGTGANNTIQSAGEIGQVITATANGTRWAHPSGWPNVTNVSAT